MTDHATKAMQLAKLAAHESTPEHEARAAGVALAKIIIRHNLAIGGVSAPKKTRDVTSDDIEDIFREAVNRTRAGAYEQRKRAAAAEPAKCKECGKTFVTGFSMGSVCFTCQLRGMDPVASAVRACDRCGRRMPGAFATTTCAWCQKAEDEKGKPRVGHTEPEWARGYEPIERCKGCASTLGIDERRGSGYCARCEQKVRPCVDCRRVPGTAKAAGTGEWTCDACRRDRAIKEEASWDKHRAEYGTPEVKVDGVPYSGFSKVEFRSSGTESGPFNPGSGPPPPVSVSYEWSARYVVDEPVAGPRAGVPCYLCGARRTAPGGLCPQCEKRAMHETVCAWGILDPTAPGGYARCVMTRNHDGRHLTQTGTPQYFYSATLGAQRPCPSCGAYMPGKIVCTDCANVTPDD